MKVVQELRRFMNLSRAANSTLGKSKLYK